MRKRERERNEHTFGHLLVSLHVYYFDQSRVVILHHYQFSSTRNGQKLQVLGIGGHSSTTTTTTTEMLKETRGPVGTID